MADLIEKIMFPNPNRMGFVQALTCLVAGVSMMLTSFLLLFVILFPVALFALFVLVLLVDGVFGTHWFEAFNAVTSST